MNIHENAENGVQIGIDQTCFQAHSDTFASTLFLITSDHVSLMLWTRKQTQFVQGDAQDRWDHGNLNRLKSACGYRSRRVDAPEHRGLTDKSWSSRICGCRNCLRVPPHTTGRPQSQRGPPSPSRKNTGLWNLIETRSWRTKCLSQQLQLQVKQEAVLDVWGEAWVGGGGLGGEWRLGWGWHIWTTFPISHYHQVLCPQGTSHDNNWYEMFLSEHISGSEAALVLPRDESALGACEQVFHEFFRITLRRNNMRGWSRQAYLARDSLPPSRLERKCHKNQSADTLERVDSSHRDARVCTKNLSTKKFLQKKNLGTVSHKCLPTLFRWFETVSAWNNAPRQTASPCIKTRRPSSFSASSSIFTQKGHPGGKMPLSETKWLAFLMAEPFCHWAGAVCHGKQHKCRGGGNFPLSEIPYKREMTARIHRAESARSSYTHTDTQKHLCQNLSQIKPEWPSAIKLINAHTSEMNALDGKKCVHQLTWSHCWPFWFACFGYFIHKLLVACAGCFLAPNNQQTLHCQT